MKIIKKISGILLLFIIAISLLTVSINAADTKSIDFINYSAITSSNNKNQIRYVQKMLNVVMNREIKASGLSFLETTGEYNWSTRYWLKQFKAKYGLTVNEYFNEQTVNKLNQIYSAKKILIKTNWLNVRNKAGENGSYVIGKVYLGDILTVYNSQWTQNNRWYMIDYNGKIGYICGHSSYVDTTFVEVDITAQTLRLYADTELYVDTPVTTGKKGVKDTKKGYQKIYFIDTNRTLQPSGAFVRYWMRFNTQGHGLHDADWRNPTNGDIFQYFGGTVYKTTWASPGTKYTGSHGCVNIPVTKMPYIYNHSKTGWGTPVYVH